MRLLTRIRSWFKPKSSTIHIQFPSTVEPGDLLVAIVGKDDGSQAEFHKVVTDDSANGLWLDEDGNPGLGSDV